MKLGFRDGGCFYSHIIQINCATQTCTHTLYLFISSFFFVKRISRLSVCTQRDWNTDKHCSILFYLSFFVFVFLNSPFGSFCRCSWVLCLPTVSRIHGGAVFIPLHHCCHYYMSLSLSIPAGNICTLAVVPSSSFLMQKMATDCEAWLNANPVGRCAGSI